MRRIASLFVICLAVVACDQARFDESVSVQPLPFQADGMRVLVTPGGLENMYQVARVDGFRLQADSENVLTSPERTVDIGPLDQTAPLNIRSARPASGRLELIVDFRNVVVPVPVRIRENVGFRLCRVEVRADRVEITAELALVSEEGEERFDVVETPETVISGVSFDVLGECELPDLSMPQAASSNFEEVVTAYVRDGFTSSAREVLGTSPLDIVGLILRRVELVRLSSFENRRGRLLFDSRLRQDDALELDNPGLSVRMDVATDAIRAECAPPVEIDGLEPVAAEPIVPSQLAPFDADVGMAFSSSVLARMAQASVLSGFACRGLEGLGTHSQVPEVLATDDARLGDLGLDTSVLGPRIRTTLAPGELPRLETRPGSNTLRLVWEDATLEMYGQIQGVWVRLLSVDAGAEFTLRPQTPSGRSFRFSIETVEVSGAEIASKMLADEPEAEVLRRWTRRALLLALNDRFEFPLPVEPSAPLEVVGVQIRPNDVLTAMRFSDE